MDNAKLPVSFINNVDPAFGVPTAEDADGMVKQLYNPQQFPFDLEQYDVNGLHEFVAHFLCLAIKVMHALMIVSSTCLCRVSNGNQGNAHTHDCVINMFVPCQQQHIEMATK